MTNTSPFSTKPTGHSFGYRGTCADCGASAMDPRGDQPCPGRDNPYFPERCRPPITKESK